MKTQRPRERAMRPQAPDANGQSEGTDGNGATIGEHANRTPESNGQQSVVKAQPPALPRRRPARPAPEAAPTAGAPAAASTEVIVPVRSRRATPAAEALGSASPTGKVAPTTAAPTGTVESVPARVWRAVVSYETLFWALILLAAFLTRFWELAPRALHHDESLHAVYSRNLYSGVGYQHDPMMHGPLQFHFIGFMYWLFGTSDATARFASAFSGVFVVMSPFFLRKQMGRVAALVCAFLLLAAPSILYFSRMAREDSIFSAMEMIMIVGLWRFISTRKPGDFYIFCAGLSLMFTIKETAYLSVAILGAFFIFLFAFQAGYAILGTLFGYLAALGGLFVFVNNGMKSGQIPQLPAIPETNPSYERIMTFAGAFLGHPLVWGATLLSVVAVVAAFSLFRSRGKQLRAATHTRSVPVLASRRTRPVEPAAGNGSSGATVPVGAAVESGREVTASTEAGELAANGADGTKTATVPVASPHRDGSAADEITPTWDTRALRPKRGTIFAHYEEGSMPHLIGSLLARPLVLLVGFLIATLIFVLFYTVFFTDVPRGIASGLFASLGYWMAQHDVQRGGQPWFYYLLLIPLYEPIGFFFSMVATLFFGWRGVRWLRRRRQERRNERDPEPGLGAFNVDRPVPFASFGSFLPLFLVAWLVGALIIYSWAGEKMPWLMVHMVRPAIFLASLFIGALLVSMARRRQERLEYAREWEEEYYRNYNPDPRPRPRSRSAAGAMFKAGVQALASAAPAPRKLAYAQAGPNGPDGTHYSTSRGAKAAAIPTRRSSGARSAPPPVTYYRQEPPWVSWNRPESVFPFASFLIVFMLLALAWGLAMSQQNYDVRFRSGNFNSWGLTWFYPIFMLVLTVSYAIWLGVGRALRYVAVSILSVMLLYQIHSGINLAYNQPDVSTELASYVQTSPDVTRAMRELETFSKATTGGKYVKIVYDSEVSWPMEWYLGDYPNKSFIGGGTPTPSEDVPVMFLGYNQLTNEALLREYVAQRYALRWWFPEEWYKNEFLPNQFLKDANGQAINDEAGMPVEAPALSQVGDALRTIGVTIFQPEYQARLWNYLMYRETPKPLGSTDFVVFIRKDVAQYWQYLQSPPPRGTDIP